MIIQRLFSKKKDKETRKMKGLALTGVGSMAAKRIVSEIASSRDGELNPEEEEIISKLKEEIKDKNINLIEGKHGSPAFIEKNKNIEKLKNNKLNKVKKKLITLGLDQKHIPIDKLDHERHNLYINKNTVKPEDLAHELGHLDSIDKKGVENFIANYRNRVSKHTKKIAPLTNFTLGLNNGKKKADGEDYDDKQRFIGMSLSAANQAPTIANEIQASKNGLKRLERLGASEGLKNRSKDNMKLAAASYVLGSTLPILKSDVSYYAGKKVGEKVRNKKNANTKK